MGHVTVILFSLWIAGFLGRTETAQPIQDPDAELRIEGFVGHAWNPRDGRVAVLDQDGARLLVFDLFLRPLAAREVDARALTAHGGFFWVETAEGGLAWWNAAASRLEPLPSDGGWTPFSDVGRTWVRGPAGRSLRFDRERGELSWSLADWEHGGEIEWGPGWATVRFRLSQPVGRYLRLRRTGAEGFDLVPIRADRRDPLLQRASLRGLVPGEAIEISHLRGVPHFPLEEWTPFERWTVPEVDPAGARPVSVLGASRSTSR